MRLLLSFSILCLPSTTSAAIVIVGQVDHLFQGGYGPGPMDSILDGHPIQITFPQDHLSDIPLFNQDYANIFSSEWIVGPYSTTRPSMKFFENLFTNPTPGPAFMHNIDLLANTIEISSGSPEDPFGVNFGVPFQSVVGTVIEVFENVSPDFSVPEPSSWLWFVGITYWLLTVTRSKQMKGDYP